MVAKMSKKNSVLSKHRKWLSDLQKTKEKLQEEYLEEEVRQSFEERSDELIVILVVAGSSSYI